VLAGPPEDDVEVPALVVELADGSEPRAVWCNEAGGLTFEIGCGELRRFVKWAPPRSGIDLSAEADRLRWARAYVPVPEVIELREDDECAALATRALPGENAACTRWAADPATAVNAIGHGLRRLHDEAPVDVCPFEWSLRSRLEVARARVASAATRPELWHPEHRRLGAEEALTRLEAAPTVDRLVVCHGDACAPNTLIDEGAWSGLVDLGSLGVADRWADLAIATWSTEWNYGPGWEPALLDAYDIEPDPDRTAYYRLLWDLT
jgi:kanamycin kinase